MVLLATLFAPLSSRAADPSQQPKAAPDYNSRILTPPPAETPRINGPKIYGQRPGRPFLYTIPATGERPLTFAAEGLPDGLSLDAHTGRITGTAPKAGEYPITLRATNSKGSADKSFKIVIGES